MNKETVNQRYFTVWRWHFYAGMFVAPFLMILAFTALGMLVMSNTVGRDNDRLSIAVPESAMQAPIATQAKTPSIPYLIVPSLNISPLVIPTR